MADEQRPMTLGAAFVVSKFTTGAWVVVLTVPALRAALSLGDEVIGVSAHPDAEQSTAR